LYLREKSREDKDKVEDSQR